MPQMEKVKYKALLQYAADGIFIMDTNGKLLEFSNQAAKILGYSYEEMSKLYIYDWDIAHSKEEAIERVRNTPREPLFFETKHKRKDGSIYDASIAAIKIDIEGQDFIKASVRDITELKEQEEKIFSNKERLRNIFNSQKDIAIITDGKEVIDGNRAFLDFFGYSSIEAFQKEHSSICDFFEGDPFEINFELLTRENRDDWAEKVLNDHNDDYKVYMNGRIFAIHGKRILSGSEYLFNFINISESYNYQKRLEHDVAMATEKIDKQYQELLNASKKAAMGDLISIIAHQLKQPINAINLATHVLVDDYEYGELTKESLHEFAGTINDRVQFMASSIDDLRNFFRPDKKKHPYSLKQAIEKAISIVSVQISSKGVALETNLENDTTLEGIENEIQQVVLNIVTNAKDAILENNIKNGVIKVGLSKKEDKAIITIEDNGGGIPENILDKIFDFYFTTKGEQGTGIGLNLAKMIVEDSMDGRLTVCNTDSGALFTIEFML